MLHGVLARLAYHSEKIGSLATGVEVRLVDHGRIDRQAMRRSGVTERDLYEAVRGKGAEDLASVKTAVLERSGRINVLLKET